MSYKGIILVGGPSTGTRFRPLSMDLPKPLFPVAGSPIIYHHVISLAKIQGMKEILLIGFYEQNVFDRFLTEMQIEFPNIYFRYLREYQAMGTAGGLNHFKDEITRGNPTDFFVLNGDIACSFPLNKMLSLSKKTGGVATVLGKKTRKLTNQYGVMVINQKNAAVEHFVEKPETFISDVISCGIYLFSKDFFSYYNEAIAKRKSEYFYGSSGNENPYFSSSAAAVEPINIECDILPYLIAKKVIYAETMGLDDFWMSVKTGSSTIIANRKYLQYFLMANPTRLTTIDASIRVVESPIGPRTVAEIIQPAYIHPTAIIDPSAKIGPNVSIGPRVLIGRGVRVRDSILLDAVEVKHDACIIHAVIGWESRIGAWSRIEGSATTENEDSSHIATKQGSKVPSAAVLGKDVVVGDEVVIRDCIVLPHKSLNASFQREIVM